MHHSDSFDRSDSNFRSMALAGVGAVAVVVLLAALTAVAWSLGSESSQTTALEVSAPQTPTPRALSFRTTNEGAPVTAPTQAPVQEPQVQSVVAESTPALLNVSIDRGLPTSNVLLLADDEGSLAKLAAEDWTAAAPGLVNLGENAAAARWINLAEIPHPNVAIEAEMRVTGKLSTVCDQSFGLVGGSESSGDIFGTGVLFPCSGSSAQARITDVSTWGDGYNVAPVLADAEFDPKGDWHTYRFELQEGEVRLLVDGDELLRDTVDPDIAPTATDIEAGLWSQGVGVEVRRIEVTALPAG
jgi:hypothetical protein